MRAFSEADPETWAWFEELTRPALVLAPPTFLRDMRADLAATGIVDAVARHYTPAIFEHLFNGPIQMQGMSDRSAVAYASRQPQILWSDIENDLQGDPACRRLRSYWHFESCGFRKAAWTCGSPELIDQCPLPSHPMRKGLLNQAAFSLFLFMRDVCDGDFVGWIDARLAAADPGEDALDRAAAMREAILEPLGNLVGVSRKVLSMAISELMLGAWPVTGSNLALTAGGSYVAVDRLVDSFLKRTGALTRFEADHPYGLACYRPDGCAALIDALAARIDARQFNPAFPAYFPRFVQFAIWHFCAADGVDICNGNRIDDRTGCGNMYCPAFASCERLPAKLAEVAAS